MSNERDAFEAYYKQRMWNLEGDSVGYFDHETNAMWRGWQARASTTMQDDVRKDAWLPIKTAPKQEAVLVAGGDCDYPCVANWSGMNDEPWCVDGQMNTYAEIGWPTHWQPLPAPPAIDKARE